MTYAQGTSVSIARSRAEIEDLITKAGGASFGSMLSSGRAVVMFELRDRRIMFELALPAADGFAYVERRGKRYRTSPQQQGQLHEQACRESWRALCLTIKAKLVSISSGVETFEEAFLAQIVVPTDEGARRFGSIAMDAISSAYASGKLPPLLGPGSA